MPIARVLIVPATKPDDPDKITVTISSARATVDSMRVLKVLAHVLGQGDEWEGHFPNVELVGQRFIEAEG